MRKAMLKLLAIAILLGIMSGGNLSNQVFACESYYYIIPDSSNRYLSNSDISYMDAQELCYAKNEIYAKHGYIFVSDELQNYFNAQSWYEGRYTKDTFSASVFNCYETSNIDLLTNREFALAPKGYQLDQGSGYCTQSSSDDGYTVSSTGSYDLGSRYLTDAEVSAMSLQQLCYKRNEIYARHGYIFQSLELQLYFGSQDWYVGTVDKDHFDNSVLNECEKANSSLLYSYEYSQSATGYALF